MRLAPFALFLAPFVVLSAGCLVLREAGALAFDESGGGGTSAGVGGGHDATIKTTTIGAGGGGGAGQTGTVPPGWFGHLCGGSAADCVPGPTSEDCAPGGNPNIGGASADGGSLMTCQLFSNNGAVQAQCAMAGAGMAGDPCKQATDCGAGLGCAETPVTGVCRQYCCGDPGLCPEHTYCTPTPMAEAPESAVPFCVPVTPCELLNDAAYCQEGEMCAVVRSDGTTSCVPVPPPDKSGAEGESCPCGPGYACSNATGTCIKLCHIGGDECGVDGTCQGGIGPYPNTIGVCVPK